MTKLDVAGILIKIKADDGCEYRKLKPFFSNSDETADLSIDIFGCDEIKNNVGEPAVNGDIRWECGSEGSKDVSLYIYENNSDEIAFRIDARESWDYARAYFSRKYYDGKYAITGPVGDILFRNRILYHSGMVIHASAIEWEGKGIIFSAPSGMGKSTQAGLWRKYKKAKVLNDDRSAIRLIKNRPYVYGIPWNVSSSKVINASAPLFSVIVLEQSEENKICRLSKQEALLRLMPRCFLPYYQKGLMDIALNNLEKIIITTPVYLLSCKPDREAVELVCECLKLS